MLEGWYVMAGLASHLPAVERMLFLLGRLLGRLLLWF